MTLDDGQIRGYLELSSYPKGRGSVVRRSPFLRGFSLLFVAVAIIGVMGACQPSAVSISTTSTDPGYSLRHDWGPGVLIEQNGGANSCFESGSSAPGRDYYCRVIDGYEAVGDHRNWRVSGSPIASGGSDTSSYGRTIVVDSGQIFEGCDWLSPSNEYICDFRQRKAVVLKTDRTWSFVLRKAWDWARYAGDAAGCAGGIAGLWSGGVITVPLLSGCLDGPM